MEQFIQAAENLGALNEYQPAVLTKDMLTDFFNDVVARDEELAAMRAENKEAFESFASSHGIGTKPLKEAYKFFKAMSKERDKIVDALLSAESNQG